MCVKLNENGVLNSQNWYNTGGLMAEVYNIGTCITRLGVQLIKTHAQNET